MFFAQVAPDSIVTPDIAWTALVPHLVLAGGAILMLMVWSLAGRWLPRWLPSMVTAAVGLGAAIGSIHLWRRVTDADRGPFSAVADSVGIDGFSVFLTVVISLTVVFAALLADGYLRRERLDGPEYHVLLLLSAAGGVTMATANDLIVLFLGLEILSLAVYVLAGYHNRRAQSQEAAIKYFVLGAFSSAFLLYGIALTYGATGSTNLVDINAYLRSTVLVDDGLLLAGFALLLVGLGFKVSAVPFHTWTPDVYQGSPTPVVAFMASGVKAAGFAALLRVFVVTFGTYADDWKPILYALAVATLLVGAILAVVQNDVKRMLAYSSISHAGFMLIGVHAASADGTASVLYYLAVYSVLVIGSFAVVGVVSGTGDGATTVGDFAGLGARRPWLAFAFTVFLLAQAGVPLTTGFFAKFYAITAAVDGRSWALAIVAMLSAVIAAYLYLRIMIAMWLEGSDDDAPIRVPVGTVVVLGVAAAFTIGFGIFPEPIVDLARDATPALVNSP
ncbi:MAG: NADH-quinone oxidoreductase subunit N [Acidimicrobiia bacterium]|nr:NADH-quinone oxidoreductase subunit N [Acidimicrobiia bacterium]